MSSQPMSRHQANGLIISLLFILAGGATARIGLDLGLVFWIVLVLFVMASLIVWASIVVLRDIRR